ncbi:hypothetical protein [Taklimakanibacter deserti]|uniref:hypothetical protein n=1 Tax=Taklimakanibacter deserti TaxID=2267839 RepID=UPI000E650A4C
MMKTTRKRKASKTGRKTGRTTAAQFLESNAGMALRRGRETISRAYGWAHDTAEGAHLGHLRMPRRSDIAHLTEANPLLLGAVGLGLGVAIGTLFPRGMNRTTSAGRRAPVASPAPVKSRRRRRKKNGTAATG